jgi:hypothetical protein
MCNVLQDILLLAVSGRYKIAAELDEIPKMERSQW